MANYKLVILGLVSSLSVSACTTIPEGSVVGVDHREAVDQAVNKQIVSTEALKGAPVQHPEMSAAAIDRYLEDKVKEPEIQGSFSPDS